MTRLIAFAVFSAGLVWVSRASLRSLRSPRPHGFYRFFAWEAILLLFLLNVDDWFHNPFSWHQIISWILLMVSFVPLAFGVHSLVTKGKAAKRRKDDGQLLGFERTTALVTTGIYRYIRHPMYSSLLLLAWGIFFKQLVWSGALTVATATLFLVATAKADEAECIQFFGPSYRVYMRQTKMFVPFLL